MPWTELLPGLRTLTRNDGATATWRSVAVDLGGRFLVYSPLKAATDAELAEVPAAALLAPNHFHHLGLQRWAERHGATAHASALARLRLARQTPVPLAPIARLEAQLPPHVRVLQPAGTKNGETWLRVEGPDGITWIVGDAFFNAAPTWSLGGLFLRATLGGPGLAIGQTFRWLGLDDPSAYGQWVLDQIVADHPVRLVPCHGEVDEGDDLIPAIKDLVKSRLRV